TAAVTAPHRRPAGQPERARPRSAAVSPWARAIPARHAVSPSPTTRWAPATPWSTAMATASTARTSPTPTSHPSHARRQVGPSWPISPGGAAGGLERQPVEDEPVVDDLAVADGEALGARAAGHRRGAGVVDQHRRGVVAEGGQQLGAEQHLGERAQKLAVGLDALDAAGGGVADDVVGEVAHGGLDVLAGPGLVVGARDLQGGAVVGGHGGLLPLRGSSWLCRHRSGGERNAAAAVGARWHAAGVEPTTLQRARDGDERAFGELTDPYRRELLVPCYRLAR